jgi:hypothetical protein
MQLKKNQNLSQRKSNNLKVRLILLNLLKLVLKRKEHLILLHMF